MPQISVIVPVYKVEDCLEFCIDSILAQTFTDFELILVDDGSPDNCGAMCDQYAKKDSRIRVIHRENGGLSAARNSGIDVATGEYITFVDSDDAVAPVYLEKLLWVAESNNADVSSCKTQNFEFEGNIKFENDDCECQAMAGREACLSIYKSNGIMNVIACAKLYKQELFDSHRFPVGKLNEDQSVIPLILFEASKVAAIDNRYYYYRIRPESIMHKPFSMKRFDNVEAIDGCVQYFKSQQDTELVEYATKTRKKVVALLNILAEKDGIRNNVPERYRVSKFRALYDCYKYSSDDTYSWYLSQIYPNGVIYHEYFKKIKSLLGLSNRD